MGDGAEGGLRYVIFGGEALECGGWRGGMSGRRECQL